MPALARSSASRLSRQIPAVATAGPSGLATSGDRPPRATPGSGRRGRGRRHRRSISPVFRWFCPAANYLIPADRGHFMLVITWTRYFVRPSATQPFQPTPYSNFAPSRVLGSVACRRGRSQRETPPPHPPGRGPLQVRSPNAQRGYPRTSFGLADRCSRASCSRPFSGGCCGGRPLARLLRTAQVPLWAGSIHTLT